MFMFVNFLVLSIKDIVIFAVKFSNFIESDSVSSAYVTVTNH